MGSGGGKRRGEKRADSGGASESHGEEGEVKRANTLSASECVCAYDNENEREKEKEKENEREGVREREGGD